MLPSSKKGLAPKDDRKGVMISVFALQELGMNLVLVEEKLCRVNERREGEAYLHEDAVNKVLGAKGKKV